MQLSFVPIYRRATVPILCLAIAVAQTTWAEEKTEPVAGVAGAEHTESKNFTQTLRVKQRSVTVTSTPQVPQEPQPGVSGQWAFLDENGQLTSTPPAGHYVPLLIPQPRFTPVETRSPVDPNAIMMDTTHIVSAVTAHIGKDGKVQTGCTHSSAIAPAQACDHESHAAAAPESKTSTKEDVQ